MHRKRLAGAHRKYCPKNPTTGHPLEECLCEMLDEIEAEGRTHLRVMRPTVRLALGLHG